MEIISDPMLFNLFVLTNLSPYHLVSAQEINIQDLVVQTYVLWSENNYEIALKFWKDFDLVQLSRFLALQNILALTLLFVA